MEDLIVFENASKTFVTPGGPVEASRDINLRVGRGEFVTLVGPSGCGKSTLLNMIAGIFPPTDGTVLYDGTPVTDYNGQVGYMTQNDHLLTWRTVAGNIAIPLEIDGLSKADRTARVRELAELVGLTNFLDSYPSQLSGGMRKRCALARLLAYSPETLLLDEPFAALDAQLRLRMQVELRSIVQQFGKTVIFVTHDLDEAVALADRCAIFTRAPGTIRKVLDVPLSRERDLFRLRHNPEYVDLTATLWDEMAPEIEQEEAV